MLVSLRGERVKDSWSLYTFLVVIRVTMEFICVQVLLFIVYFLICLHKCI